MDEGMQRHGNAGHDGFKLRSRDGHFEMVSFDLKRVEGGYWMWVACDVDGHDGGHWIAPATGDATPAPHGRSVGPVRVVSRPYVWPSPVEAFAARDAWEEQDGVNPSGDEPDDWADPL